MAVTSDASPFTSVTASPMEPHDPNELPIELKIPLPSSSVCSGQVEEKGIITEDSVQGSTDAHMPGKEDLHPDNGSLVPEAHGDNGLEASKLESSSGTAVALEELAYLVKLEAYQQRQTIAAQVEVERLRLSYGLDRRLLSTLTIAYGNMIDQYKTDDQAGFAGLFDACEQLKAACDSVDCSIGSTETTPKDDIVTGVNQESQSPIHKLPPLEQETVLTFLTRIRTEPNFLSEKVSNMSSAGLTALTSSYHPAGIDFSILQNHSHGKSHLFSRDSQMMKLSRRMDNLHRFHDQDPFFALLYGVFDVSARPGSGEHNRRVDVWSTVCARNMIEGFSGSRPGADELAIATLDAFASFQDWSLKPRMEAFLRKLLAEGSFLLEAPSSQAVDFREPLETHYAKAAIAEADFFEKALTDLFELLTAEGFLQPVPPSVLTFAHAVLRKIEDAKLRIRAQQFIVIRWYFATFLSSVIVYPEIGGLVMTHHIGETARRSIWQKLVVRMQERVFDVILPWNDHSLVKPEIRDGILAIFDAFSPPVLETCGPALESADDTNKASSRFLMLTPLDIVGLVQALCLEKTSLRDDQACTDPKLDRPSTAGSSTLVADSSAGSSAADSSATADCAVGMNPTTQPVIEIPAEEGNPSGSLSPQPRLDQAKPSDLRLEDMEARLGRICQKLKNSAGRGENTSAVLSLNLWTHVYYSEDGSMVSFKPMQHSDFRPTSPRHVERSSLESDPTTFSTLKKAMTLLLSQSGESGLDLLRASIVPQATRGKTRDPLEVCLEMAMKKAQSALKFGEAHTWWQNLKVYRRYLASNPLGSFRSLLQDLSDDLKVCIDTAANIAQQCMNQCRTLAHLRDHGKKSLAELEKVRNSLRVKMWYVSDVRHSATYEEALYVTRALRSMASFKRPKQSGSIHSWARQRLRGSNVHDRAEAQTLETMVASKDQGGPTKMADGQIELTSRWLTRESIENFCKGEERIHRFCYEVHKSIGKIAGTSLLESPVLWSSNLFRRERLSFDTQPSRSSALGSPFHASFVPPVHYEHGNLRSPQPGSSHLSPPPQAGPRFKSPPSSFGGFWSGNHPSRGPAGLGLYNTQPSHLPLTPISPPTSWSNHPFTPSTPPFTPGSFLPSNVFLATDLSSRTSEGESSSNRIAFAEDIRKSLCSLLISDLGYLLWNQGSETDSWVNEVISQDQSDMNSSNVLKEQSQNLNTASEPISQQDWGPAAGPPSGSSMLASESRLHETTTQQDQPDSFPFTQAYSVLLRNMSLSQDPFVKLELLAELENLILMSMAPENQTDPENSGPSRATPRNDTFSLRNKSVPRTKANSLEEVIANCTERRAGTLKARGTNPPSLPFGLATDVPESNIPGTDDIVSAMLSIFKDPKVRPTTLFRDLQYIAAFVPSTTLDQTAKGKAFWDAGLAALALKEDLCGLMIKRANAITSYHVPPGDSPEPAADSVPVSTTLRDAARLWLTTAKEGSAVAARELGLFYLTHPELLPRVTMPFAKAKDVFRSVLLSDMGGSEKDSGALDPHTFAVVFHWMEVAANAGDKDARDFLRGNGELSGGR